MDQNQYDNEHIEQYQLPFKHKDGSLYEFALVRKNGINFLTDQGATYKQLDNTFFLDEPDVIMNIVKILKEYKVNKIGNDFLVELVGWDGNTDSEASGVLAEAKYRLFACVSFTERMGIFYD